MTQSCTRFPGKSSVAAVIAAALALAGCGGSDDRREEVEAYLLRVNAVSARHAPGLRAAERALRAFAAGRLGGATQTGLERGARAMTAVHRALEPIDPPREARALHRDLLVLYARQIGLAREVRSLAAFVPAASRPLDDLRAANAAFDARVRGRPPAAVQAAALGRYAARVDAIAAALAAPRVMRRWRDDHVAWLRSVGSAARRLASALRGRDRAATEAAAERFRARSARQPPVTRARRRAVLAYNARVGEIRRLTRRVARERAALERLP
jgi:hypothetical protein